MTSAAQLRSGHLRGHLKPLPCKSQRGRGWDFRECLEDESQGGREAELLEGLWELAADGTVSGRITPALP